MKLFRWGKYYRVWPYADKKGQAIYFTVSLGRPYTRPICKLFRMNPRTETFEELVDFYKLNKHATTTGQPFVSDDGTIYVPVWNALFYTHGFTYFAIYRSEDGYNWNKVYEDVHGTYANHFFQDSLEGKIYIGVGVGGGGFKGRISFTPASAYLLCSENSGYRWTKVFKVNVPTAMYDGKVFGDVMVASLREAKSIVIGNSKRQSFKVKFLGTTARNIAFHNGDFWVSSDGTVYILPASNPEGLQRIIFPLKLVLRYPTFYTKTLLVSAVGWRSFLMGLDMRDSKFAYLDLTKLLGGTYWSRFSLIDKKVFIGDEFEIGAMVIFDKFPSCMRTFTDKDSAIYKIIEKTTFLRDVCLAKLHGILK